MPDAAADRGPGAAGRAGEPPAVPALVRRYRRFGSIASLAATAVGLLVLAGWALGIEPLKRVLPGMVAMNPATAVGFLLAGGALSLRSFVAPEEPRVRPALRAAGAALVVIAGWRLVAYAAGLDLGLDTVLFPAALARETPVNRMAPNTATAFFITGVALLVMELRGRAMARLGQVLGFLLLLIAILTITGYVYRVPDLARVAAFIPMALNTALAFTGVAFGLLLLEPTRGWTRSLVLDAEGGRVARRLLPAAIVLPVVLGWIGMRGQAAGLFDTQTAVSGMVALGSLLLCAVILWTAETLIGAETLRTRVELREARLQRALRHRAQQIEAANAELEAFSYSVSHDLRAPLRSITGFSQALLEDHAPALDGEARDYLDRVVRAGRRMDGLIDDLLRLSRVARADMQPVQVDLSALAREIVAQLQAAHPDRRVDVVVPDGLAATGDPQLLRVALDNLLQNAWKYTGRCDDPRIEVGCDGRADGVPVFFVRDNGAGFDMAHAHKLFSPFQRLHADDQFPGSGIGLATVRRVVRRHGGRAWAEAETGRGATFFFTLDSNPEARGA